jgi:cytochrome c5
LQDDSKHSPILGGKMVAIIFIAIVAVVFYIYAKKMSGYTAGVDTRRDVEVHDTVAERIRPFGRVKLPGEEHGPDELKIDEVPQAEPHATVMSGPQVFNEACIVCHGNGIGGAPMLNDRAAWQPRIAQGMATLYQHAIEGYTGSTGYMPPKGARLDLSDLEVNGAVDYMLSQLPN